MKTTAAQPLMTVHGRAAATVQSASCGAVPMSTHLTASVPLTVAGTMPRKGTTSSGSGLPGRFRNSDGRSFTLERTGLTMLIPFSQRLL